MTTHNENCAPAAMKMSRCFAWPNKSTFSIPPISAFVERWLNGGSTIIDPFARNATYATYTNDIDPESSAAYHMEAMVFLAMLIDRGVKADRIIFDPPYSPTQIARSYRNAGLSVTMTDTQSAKLKGDCRKLFRKLAEPGCVVLSFGWNTCGMGEGWITEEILLVSHGGDHNDTICAAHRLSATAQPPRRS